MEKIKIELVSITDYALSKRKARNSTICNHRRKERSQTSYPASHEASAPLSFVRIVAHDDEKHADSGIRLRIGNAVLEIDECFNASVLAKVLGVLIAVRLRSNKKVQNLSKMCYKFFRQPLVAQGDFGHEFS